MSKWQALTNISVPQKGSANGQTDLVTRGNTVEMTDAAAAEVNQRHAVDVLRPAREASTPMPVITARQLMGRRPQPGADARPDPQGSTQVYQLTPEATDPQPLPDGTPAAPLLDALDIPPTGRARAAAGV
jgi:hypothetical protein